MPLRRVSNAHLCQALSLSMYIIFSFNYQKMPKGIGTLVPFPDEKMEDQGFVGFESPCSELWLTSYTHTEAHNVHTPPPPLTTAEFKLRGMKSPSPWDC